MHRVQAPRRNDLQLRTGYTVPRPHHAHHAPPPLHQHLQPLAVKDARQAKAAARVWVETHAGAGRWPGIRAAHLVGGITSMADAARFPADKDVDMHLIFAEGSPALTNATPGPLILEEPFSGVSIEAGLKSIAEYRSAEAVLANPEIAHHLLVDSILYDPDGLLRGLQEEVRRGYPRRRWVLARLEHERRGQAGALEMLPMARATWGASGEVNILGYTMTFAAAALWVAALQPPRIGGRVLPRMREVLAAHGRIDLHEELLEILGLSCIGPSAVERFLQEASETFDLALAIRQENPAVAREFAPFAHKLHAHLRPYFVEACRGMLAEGHHREAMGWVVPYHLATADVVLAHGPESEKPAVAARQLALLQAMGLGTASERAIAIERARRLYDRIFVLAEEIVASHPEVVE